MGASTYENSLFPPVAELLRMAVHKRIRARQTAWFGSYGWSGGAEKEFREIVAGAEWTVVDAFEFCGRPTPEDLRKGEQLGRKFAQVVLESP